MKPVLPALLFALLTSLTSARAAYQDVVLGDQPVGYWRLGDAAGSTTATNSGSLGAAGDGSILNNVTFGIPGAVTGNADTAVNFDGAQAKIDMPFNAAWNTPTFTIEAWARVASGSVGYRSPVASRDDSPQRGFIFYADPADNWQFWTGTGVQVGWNVVNGTLLEYDAWAHLVGVYDGTNKFFYVNGVLVGVNRSAFAPNGARPLRIGASATESVIGDFFFNGDVDEVAVYDKVLGPAAVVAHFTSGAGSPPDSTIGPTIGVQPASVDRFKGESLTLSGLATGSLPLTYQWQRNGADIAGASAPDLVLTNLQPADGGDYTLVVSNSAGDATSDVATISVADVAKPVITTQPRSRTVLPGTTASLFVAASGSTFFNYQWQLGGQNLPGATNATLTLTNLQAANLGTYKVIVSNAAGSTDSETATLQFPAPSTKSYADTVRDDSPVGYWRLGESEGEVADDAIATNDGAYLNGVTQGRPGALVGDTNTAAGFASANLTKIDVPWTADLNPPTFTVECWAKVTGGAGNYRSPVTSRADGPQRGYIFYAEPGNTWQFWIGDGLGNGWTSVQGPAVQPNAYAHLVGVYDGTNLLFYVNGVLSGQSVTAFAPNDASPLRIGGGASEGDGNYFFEGDVDEVAIFSTALSEDRILAHYIAGFPLTTPPSITQQPKSQFALAGRTARFAVGADGGQPLNYQWNFNGQNLTGGTASVLTISNVSVGNVGDYFVVVSNTGGSVTSSVATLSIPAPPTQSYLELVKADGPVAYWRLGEADGEVADDEIGTSDGTYLNAVTLGLPGAIAGDTNTAVGFSSAASQKVDVPWSEILNPPRFTVELWARVTGNVVNHRSPLTSRADSPQRGYIFYAEPGNTWQFWSGKGDQTGWDNIPGPAVRTNQWDYLAATFDGTTKRFFVNGVEVGTSTAPFAPNDVNVLRIGGGSTEGDGTFFFEGDVDEPAVYDKVLSDERIILHYLAGVASETPPAINIARQTTGIAVTWDAGSLESAPGVTGPWSAVAGATSPYAVNPAAQVGAFYRARK